MNHAAIEKLDDLGQSRADEKWRNGILLRHKWFIVELSQRYHQIAAAQSIPDANQFLLKMDERLRLLNTGLYCHSTDDDICSYANAKSMALQKDIYRVFRAFKYEQAVDFIVSLVRKVGIDYPYDFDKYGYDKTRLISAMARVIDPQWWRRKLRVIQKRQIEAVIREFGQVNKSKNIYVSDFNFNRRKAQKAANRKLLEGLEAVNQEGQSYTLQELSDLSPSNPIIRRNEMMARISGFEQYANNNHYAVDPFLGPIRWEAMFYTVTCPSKYHAFGAEGKSNPKFGGFTPLEGSQYLNKVWQRVRAEWSRRNIPIFGVRVAEPHHDGTPHWHLVLWTPAHRVIEAAYVFNHYAFEVDGNEPGAIKHRFIAKWIDPAKGTAAGYCVKYVSKNIDGHGVGYDSYGRDAIISAARIEAWASTWGIRQFQQIGGAGVTVWRELRRLEKEGLEGSLLGDLVAAADSGDWEKYNLLMGGIVCKRKDRPVRPEYQEKGESKYGEVAKVLHGIAICGASWCTRLYDWVIRPARALSEAMRPELRGPPEVAFG